MRLRLSLLCFALTMIVVPLANAQIPQAYPGPGPGSQANFQPMAGDLNVRMPGRVWFESNFADQGFGYQGSYLSLGGKSRLFEDRLSGRWLGEGRIHQSLEDGGGLFANIGIERVFSIDAAGAEVSVGGWYDYDSDQQGSFAHTFNQVGLSAAIKTRKWDLVGNGYFPVGTSDYAQGDPTGEECFFGNSIVMQHGIDSALKGFDATLRIRPKQFAFMNGTLDIGGYGYESDLVEFFGGGRARFGFQFLGGGIVSAEVNYDDRFDTTGSLSVGWIFGANARGNEYAGIGRDLEKTLRRDHITRFHRDPVLALDPDTGQPYNVYVVDNTADAAIGNGTGETPFATLLEAQNASNAGDIIFVRAGDGTARGQRDGIVLKNDQLLLGDGVNQVIPVQNGLNFVLCTTDNGRATISASDRGNAVTLANNNVVRGLNIDGSAGIGGMANGIFGDGFFRADGVIRDGVIENNIVSNAILHGTFLNDVGGDWEFRNNDMSNNGIDGTYILNACDPNSTFVFEDNSYTFNGVDGLHLENYDAASITFLRNTTSNNARDGLRLENFKNQSGEGLVLDLLNHTATGNIGFGVNIIGGDGNLQVLNANLSGNAGGGLRIEDWTNTDPTTVTTVRGGTFSNNNAGVGIDILLTEGTQNLLVTENTADNNGFGLRTTTNGIGVTLNSRIIDNFSFSNNGVDGIRAYAQGGSSQTVLIDQPNLAAAASLPIVGNNSNGINLIAGIDAVGATSSISAIVRNVALTGNGTGLRASSTQDGQIDLLAEDLNVQNNGIGLSFLANNNNNQALNRFVLRRLLLDNNGGDGIQLNTFGGTIAELYLANSTITGSLSDFNPPGGPAQAGPVFTDANAGISQGVGVNVTANGNAGTPEIDNFTRVSILDNLISNQDFGGVSLISNGDASLLANVEGNNIEFNGFGGGDNGGGTTQGVLGFGNGVQAISNGNSTLNYTLKGNIIQSSFEFGVNQLINGTSSMNTVWTGNDITGNDIADDPTTTPAFEANGISFASIQAAGAELCWSLSSNSFANEVIINQGAGADFLLELDGVTNANAFDFADVLTPNTPTPFGTVCQPNIDAAAGAFEAAGFPPLDH